MTQMSSEISRAFDRLCASENKIASTLSIERIQKLKRLHRVILKNREEIRMCLYNAFSKPAAEVDLIEIYSLTSEIKHVCRNLKYWMGDRSTPTPISLFGASSHIRYEPKGTSLIIAPWNFPFQLTLGPLISAVSAGCPAIIKPSEYVPAAGVLIKKIVGEVFDENEVVVIEGGVETSKTLLSLPFRHIFFTGSTRVGKIVMESAAKHLTSTTLELGGKNPNIIDETANIKQAARRTVLTKFTNAGQICIAPDYVLIHKDILRPFVEEVKNVLTSFYGEEAEKSNSYTRMVSEAHFDKVSAALRSAVENGATIEYGGKSNRSDRFIEPTVLTNVPKRGALYEEEIFGPILPVIPFSGKEEAISMINQFPRPLGLYIYSRNKKNIDYFLNSTRAGGSVINFGAIHFFNAHLPFGGINRSGIGKAHGHFGFLEFSNRRPVLRQHIPGALEFLTPPYNNWKQKLIDFTIRWL